MYFHPLLSIHTRRQTYGDWRDPRSYERARRAFYKWVSKQELYGPLQFGVAWHGRIEHWRGTPTYNYGGWGFARGYPSWEASRSAARDAWEAEFHRHKERVKEEDDRRWQAERDARERMALVRDRRTTRFFKIASVGGALAR